MTNPEEEKQPRMIICPECCGLQKLMFISLYGERKELPCPVCDGEGEIEEDAQDAADDAAEARREAKLGK